MHGSTFYDHISVKLELLLPVDKSHVHVVDIAMRTHDSGSNKKGFIAWNTVTDVGISEHVNRKLFNCRNDVSQLILFWFFTHA